MPSNPGGHSQGRGGAKEGSRSGSPAPKSEASVSTVKPHLTLAHSCLLVMEEAKAQLVLLSTESTGSFVKLPQSKCAESAARLGSGHERSLHSPCTLIVPGLVPGQDL